MKLDLSYRSWLQCRVKRYAIRANQGTDGIGFGHLTLIIDRGKDRGGNQKLVLNKVSGIF